MIVGENQMNKPGGTIPNTDHLEREVKNIVVHTLYSQGFTSKTRHSKY